MKNSGMAVYILVISLLALLFLFGCTQPGNQAPSQNPNGLSGAPQGDYEAGGNGGPNGGGFRNGNFTRNGTRFGNDSRGFGNGTFGNLTDAQRQQMAAERLKQEMDACKDLANGDSCTLVSSFGNRTGTCDTVNGNLLCNVPRPSIDAKQPA